MGVSQAPAPLQLFPLLTHLADTFQMRKLGGSGGMMAPGPQAVRGKVEV